MGVMSKLLESHKAPAAAATQPNIDQPSATVGTLSAGSSGSSTAPTWPSNWPTPMPCPACLSPGFWVDVYGGGPHCRGCNPTSSPSLVAMPAWVIGTPDAYRWVRNPKAEDDRRNDLAGSVDDGEFVTWQLPNGDTATALRERVDHTRVAMISEDGSTRRYSPALACGPVGDLTLDEWFDRLPELPTAGIGTK